MRQIGVGLKNWILIQVFDEPEWDRLKQITDLKYGRLSDRIQRRAQLNEELSDWTRTKDKKALMEELQHTGICASVLNNSSELLNDPQLLDRNYVQWLKRDFVGTIPHPSTPYRSGKEPIPISKPAPTLGQHNKEILGSLLELSESDLAELTSEGIIGTKPRLPK